MSSVVNDGWISATSYVGLLAPGVENRGTIVVADLGSVALASGEAAVMDFLGDGLISFAVTAAVNGLVLDENGDAVKGGINNSGLIRANGGQVLMTAEAAGDVIESVVNHSGIIEAQTVEEKDGVIILSGGSQGVVNITGLLDASGNETDEAGGRVEITGEQVGLFDSAEIDVSGDVGGGTARVEGDDIYIDQDVVINADALTSGDGGTVNVSADDVARIYGMISARGGATGGNGGRVHISGGNSLEVLNVPNVGAPNGAAGEWHVASSSIDIVDGTGRINIFERAEEDHGDDDHEGHANGDGQGHEDHGNGEGIGHDKHHGDDDDHGSSVEGAFLAFGEGAELGAGLIVVALDDGATVVVSAEGSETSDTTLSADLNVTGDRSSNLTLNAYNDVLINANITSDQAPLDLELNADTDVDGFGDVVIGEFSNIFTHNGSPDIQMNDITLLGSLDSGDAGTTFNFLQDFHMGDFAEGERGLSNQELGNITADHLVANTVGSITVQGVDLSGGNIGSTVQLNSGSSIFSGSTSIFPALEVFADDGITIDVDLTTDTGDLVLDGDADNAGDTNDNISIGDGIILASAGSLSLDATTGGISAAGAVTLNADDGITINDDFASAGTTTIDSDVDNDGAGTFTVASGQNLSTGGNALFITADDIDLFGTTDSGVADTTITVSDGDNIGLGDADCGGACGLTLDDTELQNITANNLIFNTGNDIFVDGADLSGGNIGSSVQLNSGNDTHYVGSSSSFSALETLSVNDINVYFDVTTDSGDFIAVADSDMDGNGEFNLFTGATITSAQDINVTVGDNTGTVNADGTFNQGRDLIINGIVVSGTGDGGTGGGDGGTGGTGETEETFFETFSQGTQGTFLSEFIQNGSLTSGC